MPYSEATLHEQAKKKLIKKITKDVIEESKNALDKTAIELCKDMSDIFDKCIDKFYNYKTTSYYRHETGLGTRDGINLYRANQFRVNCGSDGHVKSVHIGWNANDMAPYRSWKDANEKSHIVSADYVLKLTMSGIRGLEDKYMNRGFAAYDNHWSVDSLTTKRNYFGTLSGTPNEIFENIENKWKTVRKKVFDRYIDN